MIDYWFLPQLWMWGVGAQTQWVAISARYTVMSGTPEKILELLLEAMRPDSSAHDPTGRGRRHPVCSLTHWVVKHSLGRARRLPQNSSGTGLAPVAGQQEVLIPVLLAGLGVLSRARRGWLLPMWD